MLEETFKVIDRLVPADTAGATRRHVFKHPDSGKETAIDFYWNQEVDVPYWIAEKCLAAPEGFSVYDEKGNEYEMREPETEGSIILRHTQVVAEYEELTLQALKARAEKIRGYSSSLSSKSELITFLMMKRKDESEAPDIVIEEDNDGAILIDV